MARCGCKGRMVRRGRKTKFVVEDPCRKHGPILEHEKAHVGRKTHSWDLAAEAALLEHEELHRRFTDSEPDNAGLYSMEVPASPKRPTWIWGQKFEG